MLGILPGMIGVVQATETVKLILGTGKPLVGRLLLYDALEMTFREMKVRKNPKCPICGPNPTIRELDRLPGVLRRPARRARRSAGVTASRRSPRAELEGPPRSGASVRSFSTCAIPRRSPFAGSPAPRSSPCPSSPNRLGELDPTTAMVVHCKSGVRSAKAITLLQAAGFSRLKNLKGGILGWIKEVDPSLADLLNSVSSEGTIGTRRSSACVIGSSPHDFCRRELDTQVESEVSRFDGCRSGVSQINVLSPCRLRRPRRSN